MMTKKELAETLQAALVLLFYHHDATTMNKLKSGVPCPACSGETWFDAPEIVNKINKAQKYIYSLEDDDD